jgi:hypothetical protein
MKPSQRRKMLKERPCNSGKSHIRKVRGKKNRKEKAAMAASAENRCRAAEERNTVMAVKAVEERNATDIAATEQRLM